MVWHFYSGMTHDKLLKKSFAGFWQMLVVWQRYQCLVEVGGGIFNGPIGVSRDASERCSMQINAWRCYRMAAYNTSVRFISSCEGGNEALGGAKGLEGVDFRCRFIARSVKSKKMTTVWDHRGPTAAVVYYILFGIVNGKKIHLSIAS